MIKSGQTIDKIVEDINTELSDRVSKSTKIADVPIQDGISADALIKGLFHVETWNLLDSKEHEWIDYHNKHCLEPGELPWDPLECRVVDKDSLPEPEIKPTGSKVIELPLIPFEELLQKRRAN